METVNLFDLGRDIIGLFPEGTDSLPPTKRLQLVRIIAGLAHVSGTIGALQELAGECFIAYKKGNDEAADRFFEVLTTIEVKPRPERKH